MCDADIMFFCVCVCAASCSLNCFSMMDSRIMYLNIFSAPLRDTTKRKIKIAGMLCVLCGFLCVFCVSFNFFGCVVFGFSLFEMHFYVSI